MSHLDSEASKKQDLPIRPATDRAQGGDARAFLTETALLRLEEGLRAQREQPDIAAELHRNGERLDPESEQQLPSTIETEVESLPGQSPPIPPLQETLPQSPPPHQTTPAQCPEDVQRAEQEIPSPPKQERRNFSEPDVVSSPPGAQALGLTEKRTADWLIVSTQINARSESPPLAPSGAAEGPLPSPPWRRPKAGLLLCALLLFVGAAAWGVSLKARTAASTDAAPINMEARGRTPSLPPDNAEATQPITNTVKTSVVTASLPPQSPAPPNEQIAHWPATPAGSETAAAQTPVEDEGKGARIKSRAWFGRIERLHTRGSRRLRGFNRYARASVALSEMASIRHRYGRCWLNSHQAYYHWGECIR